MSDLEINLRNTQTKSNTEIMAQRRSEERGSYVGNHNELKLLYVLVFGGDREGWPDDDDDGDGDGGAANKVATKQKTDNALWVILP